MSTASNLHSLKYIFLRSPSYLFLIVILQKYYLVVMLVEVTSVAQLVDRLRKGKYQSSQDVLANGEYIAADANRVAYPS
jgi:hypothetical protein